MDPPPAPAGDVPRRVVLHVVSPSAEAKRLSFPDTPLSSTIADIKLKIQAAVPSSPLPDRQRLIYQGRALTTPTATLESLFGPEACSAFDAFTLHLVLPLPAASVQPSVSSGSHGTATPTPPGPAALAQPSNVTAGVHMDDASARPAAPPAPATAPVANDTMPPNHPLRPQNFPPPPNQYVPNRPQAPLGYMMGGGVNFPGNPYPGMYPGGALPYPAQVPRSGIPVHVTEQMRQVRAHHMQQYQALQRQLAGQQNARNLPSQNGAAQPNPGGPEAASSPPNADGSEPQRDGNTFVQEGHGPNGQWRVVVNQTTFPRLQDPRFNGLGNQPPTNTAPNPQTSTHAAPTQPVQAFAPMNPPFALPLSNSPFPPPNLGRQAGQVPNSFPPLVYLVSSPTGYQGLLVPPHAANHRSAHPSPTAHDPFDVPALPHDEIDDNQHAEGPDAAQVHGQQAQQNGNDEVDLLRLIFPLGGHLWLLIRLAGLVYLIAGGATWSRTLLLSSLATLVFVAQAGWLTPVYRQLAEPLRRHLEGLIRVDDAPAPPQQQLQPPQPPQPPHAQPPPVPAPARARSHDLNTTPEELAARLLRQQAERAPSLARSAVRRVERAVALFVASLVPGVGEGHVAAQQAAEIERQRVEHEREVAARRAEERGAEEREGEGRGEDAGAGVGVEGDADAERRDGGEEPLVAGGM